MKTLKSPVALILISGGIVAAYLFWLKPMLDAKAIDPAEAKRQKLVEALRKQAANPSAISTQKLSSQTLAAIK